MCTHMAGVHGTSRDSMRSARTPASTFAKGRGQSVRFSASVVRSHLAYRCCGATTYIISVDSLSARDSSFWFHRSISIPPWRVPCICIIGWGFCHHLVTRGGQVLTVAQSVGLGSRSKMRRVGTFSGSDNRAEACHRCVSWCKVARDSSCAIRIICVLACSVLDSYRGTPIRIQVRWLAGGNSAIRGGRSSPICLVTSSSLNGTGSVGRRRVIKLTPNIR